MKAPSPLLGFNNNVRHKGRVFHIQTEDSGVRHPHVITHLFADGGRILKTTKTSYTEHIGQPAMADTVRAMMQEQHKSMFIALRDGQFDSLFEETSGSAAARAAAKTGSTPAVSAPEPPPVAAIAAPIEAPPPSAPVVAAPMPEPVSAMGATQEMVIPAPPSRRSSSRPRLDLDPSTIHAREPTPQSIRIAESALDAAIDLDLDALERAAAEAQTPFFQQIQDLPPPPATVLGKRPSSSGYSVTPSYESSFTTGPQITSSSPQVGRPAPPAPGRVPPPPAPQSLKVDATGSGRYAPSRPAAIFATTRPPEGASIFGEDLISEKSLDEVILSYLAEDLEGPTEKK